MNCEEVDIAHSLQIDVAQATPFLPLAISFSFSLLSLPSLLGACYFEGVKPRREEMQTVCNIYFLAVHKSMIHQMKQIGGDKLCRILMVKELRVDFLE